MTSAEKQGLENIGLYPCHNECALCGIAQKKRCLCTPGNFCPETKMKSPEQCLAKKWQDMRGQRTCKNCPAGFICKGINEGISRLTYEMECEAGYRCIEGKDEYEPCQVGEYTADRRQFVCKYTPPGY